MAQVKPDSLTAALDAEREPDLLTPTFTDAGNCERLILLWGKDLRYCHPMRKWFVWDGARWAADTNGQARKLAKQAMFDFLLAAEKNKDAANFARKSLDDRAVTRMLHMAECEIYVTPEQLDQDPNSLNFQNGTVDLRSGKLRGHRREDYITKLVHHDYIPGAACPRWTKFINQIMNGDVGMIAYLRRAFGYSFTARTIEKAVFVPYGSGDNGKSTMLSTIRELVREYSTLLDADSLMARQADNNTRADLRT